MTVVLGVNKGATAAGKRLIDGGACLMVDGEIQFALAEERLARANGQRQKHAGGFEAAAQACLGSIALTGRSLDALVYSTCCEPMGAAFVSGIAAAITLESSHHVAHALCAFAQSPFDECLTLVADSGGNVLSADTSTRWWEQPREQVSWFHLRCDTIELVDRDFAEPFAMGFGELFRAMTFYCGWPTARRSGDAMTIAAFGSRHRLLSTSLFSIDPSGAIKAPLLNENPVDPLQAMQGFLIRSGIKLAPRLPGAPLSEGHCDLADAVQSSIADAAVQKALRQSEKSGVRAWCLSGGLAYNTPLARRFRETFGPDNVFVGLASGDHGQCLGNAAYGHFHLRGNVPKLTRRSPYLGAEIRPTPSDLEGVLRSTGRRFRFQPVKNYNAIIERLKRGDIVAVARERSEFGPRALGNRSLLASPFVAGMRRKLNRLKGRAAYMPVAPAVIWPDAEGMFHIEAPSEHMAQIYEVKAPWAERLSEVTHIDGTARLQCVTAETNPWLFGLLRSFAQQSDGPCLGNTSLNGPNQPIIETLQDLADYLAEAPVNCCVIGDFFAELEASTTHGGEWAMHLTRAEFDEDVSELAPGRQADLLRRIRHTFGEQIDLAPRRRFALEREYIDWVRTRRKITTVRYNKNAIDVPERLRLDVVPTIAFERIGDADRLAVDTYDIVRLSIKRFGELNDVDGRNDGFTDGAELRTTLQQIYGPIATDELVTIYYIRPVERQRIAV